MIVSPPHPQPIWSAPLVPVAVALTLGIIVDRTFAVPLIASLSVGLFVFLAWLIFVNSRHKWLALVYLWTSVASLGGAYHHWQRHLLDADDLSHFLDQDPRPTRLRGTLHTAPIKRNAKDDPFRTLPAKPATRFVMRVTYRQDLATRDWHPTNGLTQVSVTGGTPEITVGDEVEILGRLALLPEPMSPGEFDFPSHFRDQGITTTLTVLESDELVVLREGWPTTLFGWLAVLRAWGQRTLERAFDTQHEVAAALLLGEGSNMSGEAWEKYMRTGVIHVLAISGQHLFVLAGFLWLISRAFRIRRIHAAFAIAVVLIVYALMTGARPPVMRSAWVMTVYCGGILLQRPVNHANAFALAWICVVMVNPSDIFSLGCQLSFLGVAVMVWGVGRWAREQSQEPLDRTMDHARTWLALVGVQSWRTLLAFYGMGLVVWLAVTPLVAANYHIVSPIALLIGPPMVFLTSIALLSGLGFFLFAGWCTPLALPFAWITQASLLGCDVLVSYTQMLPFAYFYVSDIPDWWLWIYYAGLFAALTLPIAWQYRRISLSLGAAWLVVLIAWMSWPHRPSELRCAFVAVGHGGCTVIETPNGGVIVYDAGATGGSEVTRRSIAPYLWSRGIRRIDLLMLSHADLDHFNGVPQLAERFCIDRAITTPTFAERGNKAMELTLAALASRGIELEVVQRGQRLQIDGVSFEVLHPPAVGPDGIENVRSLVLHVKHGDWSMLLTGDLEEAGLAQVLQLPPKKVDVLMAPHHGSDRSNIPALAIWARPKLVVSSQAMSKADRANVAMYEKIGAKYLSTWPHGTITIRPTATMSVATHRTKLSLRPF